jgi:hypothetical protein
LEQANSAASRYYVTIDPIYSAILSGPVFAGYQPSRTWAHPNQPTGYWKMKVQFLAQNTSEFSLILRLTLFKNQ